MNTVDLCLKFDHRIVPGTGPVALRSRETGTRRQIVQLDIRQHRAAPPGLTTEIGDRILRHLPGAGGDDRPRGQTEDSHGEFPLTDSFRHFPTTIESLWSRHRCQVSSHLKMIGKGAHFRTRKIGKPAT